MSDRSFEVVLREVARRGGGEAELYAARSRARRYEAREGRLDAISFSDTLTLGLRVFRGNRMGFSYGFLGDDADLARMAEEAAFCAESSDPDDAYGLPDIDAAPAELSALRPRRGIRLRGGERGVHAVARGGRSWRATRG